MDVISHALWSGIIARLINFKRRARLKISLAAFWGAMPDVFAFAPLFAWLLFKIFILGEMNVASIQHPEDFEPPQADTFFIYQLTNFLYSLSHSLVVFILVFVLLWLLRKKFIELFAWGLHILIDIPTHSFQFYPTPFLWPFSDYRFNGFSWADPWFLFFNYSAILLVYMALRWKSGKNYLENKKALGFSKSGENWRPRLRSPWPVML